MKLDILVFAAHPDDAELSCAGTIISHIKLGKKVGIVDLTQGELGTRGTAETRKQESDLATKILGLHIRENIRLQDGYFQNEPAQQLELIKMIRKYRPEIVLANAIEDRHPDHGKGARIASDACFYSGLAKVESEIDCQKQTAWRPKAVYHYIQDRYIKPDFIVDISEHWEQKLESIRAFKTQFFDPASQEPDTYISSPDFVKFLEARSREMGHAIGTTYGEGFTIEKKIGVRNLFDLI